MSNKLLFSLIAFGSAMGAYAQTLVLNAEADARVINDWAPGFADTNYGTDILSTFNEGPIVQRIFIRFNLASIPLNQTVTSATLRLFNDVASGNSFESFIYRITDNWTENEVTWNSRQTGTPWSTQGGSFVGTTGVQGTDPYSYSPGAILAGWTEWDVTGLVGEWNDGEFSNYGFAITSTPINRMVYTSREGATSNAQYSSFVPELVVSYEPVPEPATLAALGLAYVGVRLRRKHS